MPTAPLPADNQRLTEQRLRLVTEELPAAMWTVDLELRITSASGAAFSRIGWEPQAFIGLSLAEFLATHHPDPEVSLDRHRRALEGETLRHRTEAATRTFDVRLEPLRGPDGAIVGAIAVALDVTERLAAEEKSAEATELARAVIESAGQGIAAYDRELRYVLWNPFMERLTGHPAQQVLGRHPQELFPQLERQGVIALLERALLGEPGQSEDLRFDYIDTGRAGWTSAIFTPRRDAHGEIDGVIAIVSDVTERKRSELVQAGYGKIASLANAGLELPLLYRGIHQVIGELMPARNFYIALLDADGSQLSFPFFVDEQDSPPGPQPLGRGLTEIVLRRGKPLLATPEVFAGLVRSGEVEMLGAASVDWLGVPLVTKTGTFGVLAVQSYSPGNRYTQQDMDILAFVSDAVALALERRLAEDAMRASERRYRLLFERNLAGFCRTTPEGRILECNDSFAHMLGYRDREEARKLSAWDLYFEAAERTAFVDRSLRERALTGREVRLRRKNGSAVWVIVNETVTEEGDPPQVVFETTLIDITERKRAEAETRRLAEMKSNFMMVTSHEMRTPLTILTGYVGLLRMGTLSALQEDSVRRCEKTLDNLNHALGDILAMLQLEQGNPPLRVAPTDVVALSQEVIEELRPFSQRRQQGLVLEVAPEVPTVSLDARRMRAAIGELVQNAIKFTPDGGEVRLGLAVEAPWLHLTVRDTGIGIEQSQLEYVFQHLYTAADARHHHSGTFEFQARGVGLGLAIVKGYAEAHGARAWAESAGLGRGSQFHLLIPL